jgi:hypothetical protein
MQTTNICQCNVNDYVLKSGNITEEFSLWQTFHSHAFLYLEISSILLKPHNLSLLEVSLIKMCEFLKNNIK